jgi:hypothetical protein
VRLFLALLAASLPGADAPQPSGGSMITYQYQILEMRGLEWRAALYPQLQPVAHQGSATIWTAPGCVVTTLVEKAERVVATPRVTANPQMKATVVQNKTRHFVSDMTRVTDNQVTTASFVGFAPRIDEATEGYSVVVSGRKIDQGVLTHFAIDDKQIVAVHPVKLTEVRETDKKQWDKLSATIQVPEFARVEVAGEWLIPNDGVLVVSLGAHTVADEKGKAVVRERLALVEARVDEGAKLSMFMAGPARVVVPMPFVKDAIRALEIPLPMPLPLPLPHPLPVVPSRSLPQALNVHGNPVPLPPLPEEHAPPTVLPDSSEPCATPQNKGQKAVLPSSSSEPMPLKPSELRDPSNDPDSTRARYNTEPECCADEMMCPLEMLAVDSGAKPSDTRRFSIPLPMNGRIEIEIGVSTPTHSRTAAKTPAKRSWSSPKAN